MSISRDQYVHDVRNFLMSQEKEKKLKNTKYFSTKRDPKLLKFSYEVHATPTIALDFVQPSLRAKFIKV